jgi:Flp pilus assembly protein TadG
MAITRLIQRIARDRNGAIAMLFAASTPILIGSVGLGVDTIQWSLAKRQLQRQADSGALAGAFALAQGADVTSTVSGDLTRNNAHTLSETLIENAPEAGPLAGEDRAVRVVLRTAMNLPFSSIIMDDGVEVAVEATAQVVANGDNCAIALEDTSETGISMGGNTTVDFKCGMASNSTSANAVTAGGSSDIIASPIMAVGGVPASSRYRTGTVRIPYSVAQRDPFAALPSDIAMGSAKNGDVGSNKSKDLTPGTYSSFKIQGEAKLAPGTYILKNTDFSVGAQGSVIGDAVVIVLTGTPPNNIGQAKVNGGAKLSMTAPTSGTYKGVLFYQDRDANDSNQSNKINGNSSSTLQGAVYFPSQEVEFTGTSGMNIKCIQLVARRLDFSGNSTVTNVCPAGSGASSFKGSAVKLVG